MPSIICPKCTHQFEATDAFREEVQRELNTKAEKWKQQKEEEFKAKEIQFQQQLEARDQQMKTLLIEERKKIQTEIETATKATIQAEFEQKLKMLTESNQEKEEKLKQAREQEVKLMQLQEDLKRKDTEMELAMKKAVLDEREKVKEQLLADEQKRLQLKETEYQLREKEFQKQLEDQKQLIEQMKRKAEQGSMQLQGEAQELLLEDLLRQTFPYDSITEVGKGVKGADCIQEVKNKLGQTAGTIIYESKRTKEFSAEWIEKLKADMRTLGADIAVIVTQTYPKDMDRMGEKDGVYICSFSEVRGLSLVLRNALLRIAEVRKSQENKGDKMSLLYDYLTGSEFNEQWKAIREGFLSMRMSIQKERDAMEKLWKAREKQLDKVLLNAAGIRGSIEGIAGAEVNLELTDDDEMPLLDE